MSARPGTSRALWTLAGALLMLAAGPLAAQQPTGPARLPVESIILSPEPGDRILQDGVLVAVSFIDRDAQLDPVTIRIEVDGRDVTAESEISAEVASWKPRQPMDAGPHRAAVTARTRNGAAIGPISWAFTVAPGYEAPATTGALAPSTSFTRLQGSITFEESGRSVTGPGAPLLADKAQVPQLWLNAGGLISGSWRYSARMFVSAYESKDRQPVNRIRFDLRSNHLNVGLGDVNPVMHDLILAGERVRGIQGDLKGGPFRVSVVKGTTRRAIAGLIDPATGNTVLRSGTYGQSLVGIRPSVGGGHVMFGLSAVRVTDDTTSIGDLRVPNAIGTGTRRVNPTPKDNVVVGADATVRLLDNRVLLQYQAAGSLLANDITGGAITESQLDSIMDAADLDPLGIDPQDYTKYFIINQSLIPLDPRGLTSLAHLASASVRAGTNILTAEWRSIGSSYYSLAYPALLRDRRGIRLRDSFSALKGALAGAAGYEMDQDNLDDVKPTTTTSSSVFAQASWQKSPSAIALVSSVRRGSRSNDLVKGKTGALDESSSAVSLGAGIPIAKVGGFATRLNLNATSINRSDPSNPSVNSKDRYFLFGFDGDTDGRESHYNVMYGINTTELTTIANSKTSFGRLVGNFRYLFRPRWTGTLDGTWTGASSKDKTTEFGLDYARRELLGGGQFEWTESSFVTLTAGVVSYADRLVPTRNTRELVSRLTVHRSF